MTAQLLISDDTLYFCLDIWTMTEAMAVNIVQLYKRRMFMS